MNRLPAPHGRGHRMRWHDDVERAKGRMIGMSINLSAEVYRRGVFQLRDRRSARVLRELPNTGFGDAVLFRIAADLEHRVTPVVGGAAKTAFAGWFCSRPDFRSSLMKRLSLPKPGRGEPRGSGRGFARAVTLDARVKIPEAIVSPTLGEEIVLLNTATGCSYGLGPVEAALGSSSLKGSAWRRFAGAWPESTRWLRNGSGGTS